MRLRHSTASFMKSSTLIVWLLVAACIAIDLAMIGELQIRRNEWPEAGGIVGVGLTFSQISLLALWAVWGRSGMLVRGVSSLLGVWGLSCLGSYSVSGGLGAAGPWFGLLLVYCGVSLVPCIIVRFSGYELLSPLSAEPPRTLSRNSPRQFTIWGLLSLMTAIGATLAVLRFAEFPVADLLELLVFITLLAATACSLLLLALYLSRLVASIIATITFLPIAGALLSLSGLSPGETTLEMVLVTCTQGAAIASAAIVLRNGGYRLNRFKESSGTTASGSQGDSDLGSEARAGEP